MLCGKFKKLIRAKRPFIIFILMFFLIAFVEANAASSSGSKLTNIPVVFSTSEMGVGFGLATVYTYKPYFQADQGQFNSVAGTAFMTTKGQSAVFIQTENYYNLDYKYKVELRHLNFPVNFYGIGDDTRFIDRESVTWNWTAVAPVILKKINEHNYLGVAFDLGVYQIKDFKDDHTQRLLKFKDQPGFKAADYFGAGLGYEHDSRDKPFYPTSGTFINAKLLFYTADFYKQMLDFRHFKQLYSEKEWILATRFTIDSMQNKVPLWLLPEVDLRGIETTRFIDKSVANFEEELRFPIAKSWKGNIFVGAGNVAQDVFSFRADKTKLTAGVGMRYVLEEEQRVHFIFDFAFHNVTDDDKNIYFYFQVLERF
ncbi:MAG: BamA/TamA family outer membrane protein [bacterium]|nr:BamA/TamA family outer membrane protein [bacterium]